MTADTFYTILMAILLIGAGGLVLFILISLSVIVLGVTRD